MSNELAQTPPLAAGSSAAESGSFLDEAINSSRNFGQQPPSQTTSTQAEVPAVVSKEKPAPTTTQATSNGKEVKPSESGNKEEKPHFKSLKEKAEWVDQNREKYEKELAEYHKQKKEWDVRQRKYEELERERDRYTQERGEWEGTRKKYDEELTEHRSWRTAFELENSPEFIEKVTSPTAKLRGDSDKLSEKYGIDKDKLWEILTMDDPLDRDEALDSFLEGADRKDLIQRRALLLEDNIDKIVQEGRKLYAKSKGLVNQINSKQAQMAEGKKIEYAKARDESWKFLQEQLPDLFNVEDPEVQELLKSAKDDEFDDSPMERALAARLPTLTRAQQGVIRKQTAEIDRLKATIAEISGARPNGVGKVQEMHAKKPVQDGAAALDEALALSGHRIR